MSTCKTPNGGDLLSCTGVPDYDELILLIARKRDDMLNFPTVEPWLRAAIAAISQAKQAEADYVLFHVNRVREEVLTV